MWIQIPENDENPDKKEIMVLPCVFAIDFLAEIPFPKGT